MRLAAVALLLLSVAALWGLGRHAVGRLSPSSVSSSASSSSSPSPSPATRPPSRLHEDAAPLPPLANGKRMSVHHEYGLDAGTFTTTTTFPLHGNAAQRGVHFRLRNAGVVHDATFQERDATLVVVVFTDRISWGPGRCVDQLFAVLRNATATTESLSLTLLTSNMDEFNAVKERLYDFISDYAQISLLFRNDFKAATKSEAARLAMLARYRNFALLSTLEAWHQHVVWMDPDVYALSPRLLETMAHAERDIIAPLLVKTSDPTATVNVQYDKRTWVAGVRDARSFKADQKRVEVRHRLSDFRATGIEWLALDSVGAKLLYVRADVHRQGVTFPVHNALPEQQPQDEADGVEASGLCYAAHFVGYKCWGLPQAPVYHHYSDIERWT